MCAAVSERRGRATRALLRRILLEPARVLLRARARYARDAWRSCSSVCGRDPTVASRRCGGVHMSVSECVRQPARVERVEGSALCGLQAGIAAPEVHAEHAETAEERHAENGRGVEIDASVHGSSPSTTSKSFWVRGRDLSTTLRASAGRGGTWLPLAHRSAPPREIPCATKPEGQTAPKRSEAVTRSGLPCAPAQLSSSIASCGRRRDTLSSTSRHHRSSSRRAAVPCSNPTA